MNLSRSILTGLYSMLHGREQKFSKAGRLISLNTVGQAVWTPRQYDKLAEESYQKNAVAFRAISEIAKCAGSVPFQLFQGTGKNRKELEDHKLLDLLARPNPLQARSLFIQSIVGFLLIAGNSYIERVGAFRGPPRELWTKRPDRMKVIPGKKGSPAAYEFSIGNGSIPFPVIPSTGQSSILHLKTFHPLNDWYGMSPIEAAAFAIDQHNEAGRWNMSRLQNDARPSGALVVDPKSGTGLDDEQYARLKADIEEKYSGAGNSGRPLLLEGGLDWKEMGLSPVDMDWLNGKHTSARDIAMALGMPAQMLGIPGDNTHRNMEEARLWLWEQTIIPILNFIIWEFNWWLTPLFGENLELVFDLDDVPALITRRHVLWDKVTKSDFLTINEKRKAVGFEPRPEGDVIMVPSKNQELGAEPEEDDESEEDGKKPKNENVVKLPPKKTVKK